MDMVACSGITGASSYTLGALVTFCVEAFIFYFIFLSGWNIPECWNRGKGLNLLVKCIKKYFESCYDMRLSVVFLKRSLKNKRLCNDENYHILILEISRYLSLCACFIDKLRKIH